MSELTGLLAANSRFAATFAAGELPARPGRSLAILTCMDARVEPLRMLGLELGDAHVIRNGGGRASDDAIRSLALSRALFGIETALVIHHTECGLRGADDPTLRAALAAAGATVRPELDLMPLPDSIADGLRSDLARIRAALVIPPGLAVHGLIYDVRTGLLTLVPD